jgi:hypothetical protein
VSGVVESTYVCRSTAAALLQLASMRTLQLPQVCNILSLCVWYGLGCINLRGSPAAAALLQCGSLRTLQLHQVCKVCVCLVLLLSSYSCCAAAVRQPTHAAPTPGVQVLRVCVCGWGASKCFRGLTAAALLLFGSLRTLQLHQVRKLRVFGIVW